MSVSTTAVAVTAVVKGETLVQRKARLDAAFHAGDKAARTVLMAHNGVRVARESRGYGRATCAKALKITGAEYWVGEFVLPKGSTEAKALIALINGLPDLKAAAKAAADKKKAADKKAAADKAAKEATQGGELTAADLV